MIRNRYHVQIADEYWLREFPGWRAMSQLERNHEMEALMEKITFALDEDRHGCVFSNELIDIRPITVPPVRLRVVRSAGYAFPNHKRYA